MGEMDDLLAEESAATEAYEGSVGMPEHVVVDRPNLGRPTVVSVRLTAEEHGRLQRAAVEVDLPISTIIRLWALDRLRAEEEGTGGTITDRLARLERAVFERSA